MSKHPITVSREAARRFLIQAFALDGFQKLSGIGDALDALESIQEDSINVCGRIHDLILWSRVKDYSPTLLAQSLYGSPRQGFEYYFPNLHILPMRDLPYFRRAMIHRRHAEGHWHRLSEDEEPVADKILKHIAENGPLRTRAAGKEDGHTVSGWGTRTTVAARVTEKLWLHGRLGIARRENFERHFDLWENCYPDTAELPLPDEAEEKAFKARKSLRSRRLFRRKPDLFAALPSDAISPVQIEGVARPWFVLTEDIERLMAAEKQTLTEVVHLLAPLDPLVYDRERNRALWDFDYTWEVYTPSAKRKWGYYVLPILYGDKIVGRVDPKLDRRTDTLKIVSLHWEPHTDIAAVRPAVEARLQELARFLGAANIEFPDAH